MDVFFDDRSLECTCMGADKLRQHWGRDRSIIIKRRLTQLLAAPTLADLQTIRPARVSSLAPPPQRFSVRIDDGSRIIVEAVIENSDTTFDLSDLRVVRSVMILGVEEL